MTVQTFKTLGQVLTHWSQIQPEHKAYTMLDNNGVEESHITYGELHSQAKKIAQTLLGSGLQSRNVILLYPPGIDFIIAFFGCLYAGVIPAPIHAPKRNRSNQKIASLVHSIDAAAILVPEAQKETYDQILSKEENWPEELPYIVTDRLFNLSPLATPELPDLDGSTLAFLQFTSGSTSLPKGVMISHSNCLSNLEMALSVTSATPESTFVSWLPHYHDLGLVAHLLHSFYGGSHCVILAPTTFVSRPLEWLRAITNYGGQYTGAPNFAYQLCVDKIRPEEQKNLDLSCLRMAINAAEPINAQTLLDFSEKFAENGFKPQMFLPAYGMAEGTVFISSGTLEQEPVYLEIDLDILGKDNIAVETNNDTHKKRLVGCGHGKLGEQLFIIDPQRNCEVPRYHVGEVWVTGPNIMAGYYQNPEATAKTLVSQKGDRLYLRTGDLGFMDEDGELYITGRLKDLIIVNGVNYYPQDIEICVGQAHKDIRSGCVIAFSVPGKTAEELVIVAELNKAGMTKMGQSGYLEEMVEAISSKIGEEFELSVTQLVFLRIGRIPKTSSGKLQRQQCKQMFLQESLDVLGRWTQSDGTQESQEAIHTQHLEKTFDEIMSMGFTHLQVFTNLMQMFTKDYEVKMVEFDLEKPLLVYGIDSVKLTEIHRQLQRKLECSLPIEVFCENKNVKGMLNEIVGAMSNNSH
ncbi:AMP-binding protein [Crocosphaera chwakensis]|uniref:Beta-ketoacyl synthase n=1 Tax=Crocosphaera chwakensis CCY0110 TaxID=391612 RepID=A3ILP8_9CHRO|nr:AMP-binding protein [Crocosphaera chwakensis]EAZ92699.1 Beta-ketoacyl synthase [Crocosphaera chwakensis CCY0110]